MQVDPSTFEDFELNHSLFDLRIDDVAIWERIRFRAFREIQKQNGMGQAHTGIEKNWRDYTRGFWLFLRNLVIKNPYFGGKHDILYVGHHRRKKREDGYWWDIYCDPIHEACGQSYLHVESPHRLEHHTPAKTSNLRYLDLAQYAGTIQQMLGVNEPTIPAIKRRKLKDAQQAIRREFDTDVDLLSRAKEQLHVRRTTLPFYEYFLKRVDPELVVMIVSYIRETLVEACDNLGIPVVELQHGVIYEHHFGYSYPDPRTKETFPDYLLTFGDFWKDAVKFPIPDERVISVGYPYLEQSIGEYKDVKSKEQLLFISQGTIGRQLSKFAMEAERHPDINHEIVYKLHPGEYNRWEAEYPWLLEADFEIVDDSDRQLYQLFAESSAQIGVGSTAVYEGLAFGLETFVYECPGSSVLQPLVDEDTANLVSSANDLASLLGHRKVSFDREYYFTPGATEQACTVIERLADEGTVYRRSVIEN
ncbi:hypothetical protein [Natronosalvus halobius]|uniref:hypothetical protein n=1 Tax=Natronosalvus halobius TaxID=2953746 RepID=UPI00209EF2C5|nr:hypothetical protein [Natronosalvus halobius]USZ71467.1 hypothetical protein NGM15_15565 [Natronosalvus halobius]